MSRPAKATINLSALRHNLSFARSLAGNKVIGVIKADAYGHGAIPIAQVLQEEQIDCLAVACIEEAIVLREAGIKTPLLLLEGFYGSDELPLMEYYNLSAVIQQKEQIEILQKWSGKPFDIWLKLDTGMHRIGFLPEEYKPAYTQLRNCPNVNRIILMTHFACADESENDYTQQQIDIFRQTTKNFTEETCLCNSAGVMHWPQAHGDWIRPGLMMLGSSPFNGPHEHDHQLQPVMELTSQIFAIRKLNAGVPISYGATYVTDRPTTVGVVAMGYADGYPRHAPSGGPVLVNGQRTRVLGRISMDMMTVDLNPIPEAKIGDTVTLWGKGLPATEVAHHAGTISYELFCNLKRVPIQYVGRSNAKSEKP
ncbi:alanine racemase [Sansalvadorimonas sp. 2012CJ34-2]|uniref:Alanine racemase n=1 Tax=Parendozoicomonas callyspongiae TaxID=2942213 RepID=A0ABT0PEF5_9GAMM|nr:alanine racemase [Sansalvadorimonas sp. 2012CJ34-2]MCL6269764.1 alanine racemase [Sansalvadorimonas sp. 2012CJ34-2]